MRKILLASLVTGSIMFGADVKPINDGPYVPQNNTSLNKSSLKMENTKTTDDLNAIKQIIENGIKIEDNIFAFDYKDNKNLFKSIKKNWVQELGFSKDGITFGFNAIDSYHIEKNLFMVDFNKNFLLVRNIIDSLEIQ